MHRANSLKVLPACTTTVFHTTMHSKNVDSRLGGYDTMLSGSYQHEFTTSSLGLMDPEDGSSKTPPKHPPSPSTRVGTLIVATLL